MRCSPRDANTGRLLTPAEIAAVYEKTDFETTLMLPDRINAMCLDLFTHLLESEPGPAVDRNSPPAVQ